MPWPEPVDGIDPRARAAVAQYQQALEESVTTGSQELLGALVTELAPFGATLLPALAEGLEHPSRDVRFPTALLLLRLSRSFPGAARTAWSDAAADIIEAALRDPDVERRLAALVTLGSYGGIPRKSMATILSYLHDADPRVRIGAAAALVQARAAAPPASDWDVDWPKLL